MKKTDYILIGVVVLVIILSIFCIKGTATDNEKKEKVTLTGESGLKEISYTEYDNHIKSAEPFMVIIEKTGCSYCELYMPIAKDVATSKNIPIYYIDIANISEDEFAKFGTSNEYFEKNTQWGTPTTLLLKGTKVIDSIGGYVEKDKLESFLEKNIVLS